MTNCLHSRLVNLQTMYHKFHQHFYTTPRTVALDVQGAKFPMAQWNQCCKCSLTEAMLQNYTSHVTGHTRYQVLLHNNVEIDQWVKVLCLTWYKTSHFWDTLPSQSLSMMPHTTKAEMFQWTTQTHTHTHTVLRSFIRDYPGEPVPEETFTHSHLSCASAILYQLPPSTTIHGILPLNLRAWQSMQVLFGLPVGLEPNEPKHAIT